MSESLQNQLYENTIQATQLAELQQHVDHRDETIAIMLDYRQHLEDKYLIIRKKKDLLHQEVGTVDTSFKGESALMLQIEMYPLSAG